MADRREKAAATASQYDQGNIAGLNDTMTRRLVASTVMTESNGGDLQITNRQGYVGRYQAGAGWLADAGYVDKEKLVEAMKHDGCDPRVVKGAEWKWAVSGGMTRFLEDSSNWRDGLSLQQYKGSAELQDGAFKINSDNAYRQAVRSGLLSENDDQAKVAGFLKARHIAGYGGAREVVTGGRVIRDSNGTSNYDYLHDITRNRDGLDAYMDLGRGMNGPVSSALTSSRNPMADGMLVQKEHGQAVRSMQEKLSGLGYTGTDGGPLVADGDFGPSTRQAVERFQRDQGLTVDGKAGPKTLQALAAAVQARESATTADTPAAPSMADPGHPDHARYRDTLEKLQTLEQQRAQGGLSALFADRQQMENAAGQVVFESRVSGMNQVDSVVARLDGQGLFAVQGQLGDPASLRVYVDHAQAVGQDVQASTRQLEALAQVQDPALAQAQAQAQAQTQAQQPAR